MMYELFKLQPENYIDGMIQYLESVKTHSSKTLQTNIIIENNLSSNEEENEDIDELPLPIKNTKTFRSSVSADVFGAHNKKETLYQELFQKLKNKNNKSQRNQ